MTDTQRPFAAAQIEGARERQEDDFAAFDLSRDGRERYLFVVADGMGGHEGAAAVTQLAVRRFCEIAREGDGDLTSCLQRALTGANAAITVAGTRDESVKGAGCAFLAAVIEDDTASWISVGDCSLFLYRDGGLRKLNDDHSMRPVFSQMVKDGSLSAAEADRHPRRHSLRSALDGGNIPLIDHAPAALPLKPGDALMLASDGIETLSERKLARFLRRQSVAPIEMVKNVLKAAWTANPRHQDNTTVVYYRFEDGSLRQASSRASHSRLLWFTLATAVLVGAAYALWH